MTKPVGDQAAYYYSLGRFMQIFALAETAMQTLLWKVSDMPDTKIAAALFSGVRIEQAAGLIRRVREAKGQPEHKQLKHIFEQLSVINNARNDIVHFGAMFSDGADALISNLRRAHMEERIRAFQVSPDVLDRMAADVGTIIMRIMKILKDDDDNPNPEEVELDTWLYKHALLTNNRRKSPGKNPKQKHPQKSSDG
jgi:hypothetical protein